MRTLPALWLLALTAFAQSPPSDLYPELFDRVQMQRVFDDSKTFADAIPREDPAAILAEYRAHPPADRAALARFVAAHFDLPAPPAPAAAPHTLTLTGHIAALWPLLQRPPATAGASLLAFDHAYVVPGGRFQELYYWDSYFTMLGLVRDGRSDVAQGMVDGFGDLIARYGHIPNGTRSYYLSRSQPPFFFRMVGLLTPNDPDASYARYLGALRAEHAFWMDTPHLVELPGGSVLNRYRDARDTPRDESYREDATLATSAQRPAPELYRDLRSAAESGWDFSSRWLADGRHLATIETTSIVPVDLNALLYGLERAIAGGCARRHDQACAKDFADRARRRRAAIDTFLWSEQDGCFYDYQWQRHEPTRKLSAATLYPLFTGAASRAQAHAVAHTVRTHLLAPGGLRTTTIATGQQWDRPNGWAPLQWIAVSGLRAYGEDDLAGDIAHRWLATVARLFDSEHRLVEKYDLEGAAKGGGGGEYALQDGFGWTNGVTRELLASFPEPQP